MLGAAPDAAARLLSLVASVNLFHAIVHFIHDIIGVCECFVARRHAQEYGAYDHCFFIGWHAASRFLLYLLFFARRALFAPPQQIWRQYLSARHKLPAFSCTANASRWRSGISIIPLKCQNIDFESDEEQATRRCRRR